MIRLFDITEANFPAVLRLAVHDDQKHFLASATGILARGYVYRNCNGRVFGIADDDVPVGLALVRDMDDDPACYDLQQFLIDKNHQHRGCGTQALRLILHLLRREGCYSCAEVCVNKDNTAALALFTRAGFVDTGYIDPDLPHCLNLRIQLNEQESE